jgi:hypothetical protein
MPNQIDKLGDSTASPGPISSEGLSYRDKAMKAFDLLISLLDEATGLLKLYLGLETGAVVLFVKVLTDVRSPTLVLSALAVSIFFFGLSALICLRLLMGVISFRGNMAVTITSTVPNWQQVFDSQIKNWQKDMKRAGNWMEWMFRLGILFAGIFVVGVLVTR